MTWRAGNAQRNEFTPRHAVRTNCQQLREPPVSIDRDDSPLKGVSVGLGGPSWGNGGNRLKKGSPTQVRWALVGARNCLKDMSQSGRKLYSRDGCVANDEAMRRGLLDVVVREQGCSHASSGEFLVHVRGICCESQNRVQSAFQSGELYLFVVTECVLDEGTSMPVLSPAACYVTGHRSFAQIGRKGLLLNMGDR